MLYCIVKSTPIATTSSPGIGLNMAIAISANAPIYTNADIGSFCVEGSVLFSTMDTFSYASCFLFLLTLSLYLRQAHGAAERNTGRLARRKAASNGLSA